MKITSIIISAILIIAILVGGFYFFGNNKSSVSNNPVPENPTTNNQVNVNSGIPASPDLDADRTVNILNDYKKIPNDLSLINYMVNLNNMLKGF